MEIEVTTSKEMRLVFIAFGSFLGLFLYSISIIEVLGTQVLQPVEGVIAVFAFLIGVGLVINIQDWQIIERSGFVSASMGMLSQKVFGFSNNIVYGYTFFLCIILLVAIVFYAVGQSHSNQNGQKQKRF